MKVKHIVLIMLIVIVLVGLVLLATYYPTEFWAFVKENISVNIDINPFALSLTSGIKRKDSE